jgi:hypothetical protein
MWIKGEGVAYYRKKWGIERKSVLSKLQDICGEGELTVSMAAVKYNIPVDTMRRMMNPLKPVEIHSRVAIYSVKDIETVV